MSGTSFAGVSMNRTEPAVASGNVAFLETTDDRENRSGRAIFDLRQAFDRMRQRVDSAFGRTVFSDQCDIGASEWCNGVAAADSLSGTAEPQIAADYMGAPPPANFQREPILLPVIPAANTAGMALFIVGLAVTWRKLRQLR